jgi:hypothetical protein
VDRPQSFQVVAYDREAGTVDVEYADGTVDEWPFTHWRALGLEPCEAPQDWTGPFDAIESDDLGTTDTGRAPANWAESIGDVEDELDRAALEREMSVATDEPQPPNRSPQPPEAGRGKPKRTK